MKIRKIGHSCLYIEEAGLKILTDPGIFSSEQNNLSGIDILLITHEHPDHCGIDSVKAIIKNNPKIKILTNASVGALLSKEGIESHRLEDGQSHTHEGVLFHAFGDEHALIHSSIPVIQNTGYLVNNKLLIPGDAFVEIDREIEVLALPVAGPWQKISEAIDYALAVKAKLTIPIHDAIYANPEFGHRWPEAILTQNGLKFTSLKNGEEIIV